MTHQPPTVPAAEVSIDEQLIRTLLYGQAPAWAELQVQYITHGWDNETWRLGEHHAIRLPRRSAAVVCLENEQRWLPTLDALVPVTTPVPRFCGSPSTDYAWPWSIVDWIPGTTAAQTPIPADQSKALARILGALHRPAPTEAPVNPYRGVPLAHRSEEFEERLEQLSLKLGVGRTARDTLAQHFPDGIDLARLREVFYEGTSTRWTDPPVWLHGDLHPKNVLVTADEVCALIDWGDLCAGDPASDLASLWMLLPGHSHDQFTSTYGLENGAELWRRARGWAVQFGVLWLLSGLDGADPDFLLNGIQTLQRCMAQSSLS